MALAKQFYSSFKSYNGWDYYLEIWVEGYSGSASEISIGAGGPVITYGTDEQDRFSPILSSKLELPFMVTNTTQDAFIKNIREQFNEQDVYIHLYRESSSGYSSVAPLWSGFVLMDLSASPDLYYPYPVTLTAVDGLSLLKEIDFSKSGTAGSYTDADMYSSNGRFTFWLKEILLKSGASTTTEGSTQDYKFTTAINWFNSVMPTITQSTDPFFQTKCNTKMFFSKDADENFTVVNCYDVLKNLLKHWGARIIYWKHIYYIVQIQEYNTAESGTYANPDNIDTRTYTKTGAFDGSSDNLGDSYWTRYNLLIDDVTGGIQKLTGSQFNYLPQLKRTQAKFIDYGNKNYFGGLPYDLTTGQTDVIYQDTISDVSVDGSMILIIPLDVTMNVAYSGTLAMSLTFRMYITDGATTYYLRYNPNNTPKYYWENATTANLNFKKTVWRSNLDNIVGTQTKVGFNELIEFKDVSGSALTLTGDWDIYTDIDNWGANSGSFKFIYNVAGLQNFSVLYAPSASTIYWTNTLNPNYQTPLNPSVIGQTNQPTAYNPNYSLNPTTSNSIVSYTSQLNINPFEGKLLIVNASASGALYGSFVSVSPNPTTKDSEIVDFGDLIWGDTLLASSEGSLKVWNGSSFVKSNVVGTWGLGSTSGTNSFTEMLLSEYLYGQTKVIESPSMRLVIGETNKNQNDGSGSRPNYVNPIGRLKGYSATGTTPYYIFKSGSFHLLKDEVDYQGYQIIRNTQTITKTDNIIIGPDILQDKTNKIGQKTPQTNTLVNKITQNSYITTVSAIKSAFGNDIAINGIFATDTSWTKGIGWSISSNKATYSGSEVESDLKQGILVNEKIYKIVVTLNLTAGAIKVKAGVSGNATELTSSGTYEVFSTCAGSTDVIFKAGSTFAGFIEKVVVQEQVPVTSININAIGTAVFKTNDVLNVADVDGDEVNEFTVSANQGASDTSISVTSKLITEDILEGSIILINQNDLAAQYQNKTKGTVGGFDITATSIDSGSVAISSYIDDDSFGTASATSLATSESIKAYVDTQVGSADTLQEVTDNGNTTTNSIMIGSASAPSEKLHVVGKGIFTDRLGVSMGSNTPQFPLDVNGVSMLRTEADMWQSEQKFMRIGRYNRNTGTGDRQHYLTAKVSDSASNNFISFNIDDGSTSNGSSYATNVLKLNGDGNALFNGNVLIGTTSEISGTKLNIVGGDVRTDGNVVIPSNGFLKTSNNNYNFIELYNASDASMIFRMGHPTVGRFQFLNSSDTEVFTIDARNERIGIGTSSPANLLHVFGGAATIEIDSTTNESVLNFDNSTTTANIKLANNDFKTELGGSEKMRILANGNVGIGTSSPSEKLHVVGDALITGDSHADAFKPAATGEPIKFKNFGSTEVARITDGGNLLLGTTTDSGGKLVVKTDGSANIQSWYTNNNLQAYINAAGDFYSNRFRAKAGSQSYPPISFESAVKWGFWYSSGLNVITNENIAATFTSGGNLLLGTTTDSGQKLQVNGSAGFFGNTSGRDVEWDASANSLDFTDNAKLRFGSSDDMKIYHDSFNTYITQSGTGNLNIRQESDGKDIILQCDDGTGGVTDYIKLDGSDTSVLFSQTIKIPDNKYLSLGGTFDFWIQHNAVNTTINNSTGDLIVQCNNNIALKSNGSERARITNGGNVLIGTTTDSGGKLVVKTDGSANIQSWYTNNNLQAYINAAGDFYSNRFRAKAGSQSYPPISFESAVKWGFWYSSGLNVITNENIAATFTSGGNLLLGTTTDSGGIMTLSGNLNLIGSADKINFQGTSGGNNEGITYKDSGGSQRFGLLFAASNIVALANRAADGKVQIRANNSTAGSGGEITVAEFEDTLIKLNQPVQVPKVNTPSDPDLNTGVIYLDSNLDLKIKINGEQGVVTRTLAQYEL